MVESGWAIPGLTDPVEIGRGGFGVVYRATEIDLDRDVAVKVLPADLPERERQRFERERRALGTLSSHPHIVTVFRSGFTEAGSPFIVMEYLPDGSAADHLSSAGPSPWTEVLELGVQLCGAIETAHRHGVLHRDIKPGNVLLSSLSGSKLADFGIARLQDAPETRSTSVTASLAHAPPEVIDGVRPGPQSDVYSLASTLYELLSGRPAHARPDDESMVPMLARLSRDPVPELPSETCPSALFACLNRAMAKAPADRQVTAGVFGEELQKIQTALGETPTRLRIGGSQAESPTSETSEPPKAVQAPQLARPHEESSQQKERKLWPLLAVVVLVAAGLALWFGMAQFNRAETSTPSTTIPERTEARTVLDALNRDEAYLNYEQYGSVTDPDGVLTFDVPTEWGESRVARESTNPIFQVSPDLNAALRGFMTPGVGVSVATRSISPNAALRLFDGQDCSAHRPADFMTNEFDGRSQLHTECGGTESAQLIVAIGSDDYTMLANFVLVDERDLAAVDRFFATLEVDVANIG